MKTKANSKKTKKNRIINKTMKSKKIRNNKTTETKQKNKTEEKLNNLLQFIAVLAIAAILLNYLMAIDRNMTFEKRAVGKQVTLMLKATGINASFYEQVIRINPYPKTDQAAMQLSRYLNERKQVQGQIELRAKHLNPDDAQIIQKYVEEEQAKGNPIYYSTAYIITTGEFGETQIEIVPECIGWIGLFAIIALILATPKINLRKKAKGILIATPIVYLVNLLRLTTTIYIGTKAGEAALHLAHDILWRIVLIGTAIIIWLAWYTRNKPN